MNAAVLGVASQGGFGHPSAFIAFTFRLTSCVVCFLLFVCICLLIFANGAWEVAAFAICIVASCALLNFGVRWCMKETPQTEQREEDGSNPRLDSVAFSTNNRESVPVS